MPLGTRLLKLLFNDLSQVQRADVAFMFTQRVALFDHSGICNYGDLYALWTCLLKLLFNKQSINTKARCRFHVYTACRFI